ncbi:hypothetical protein [Shewanella surugensis]|uniref:Glycosylase n=1 Tax=Shewanella surugensis TaxID=212020 RepID=A0ABT0L949_9GAMM|nr:hypothetical protein [Shewanella surugensis]MCL1123895.1 hypothetical protein [Shewanella surugensis]
MLWNKLGFIDTDEIAFDWASNSALTPTPFLLDDMTIRVYSGMRDEEGISRIGYVDLSIDDPTKVINYSQKPCLDIGFDGGFDDNGIILGDIIRSENELWMYYVGFQLVKKAKFLAFSGLAISKDRGETFSRTQNTPILDRSDNGLTINAIHTVIKENGIYRCWYAAGDSWQNIGGVDYPKYNIHYTESSDGVTFNKDRVDILCIDNENEEYRIGRPSVYKIKDGYLMFYTKGTKTGKDYYPGVAYSQDGIKWERKDDDFGLPLSYDGFDSIHLCYPRLLAVGNKVYCFYNGNNMGRHGFGVAELLEW